MTRYNDSTSAPVEADRDWIDTIPGSDSAVPESDLARTIRRADMAVWIICWSVVGWMIGGLIGMAT